MLKLSETTVSSWSNRYAWKQRRSSEAMTREAAEATIYELIDYQLKALKARKDQWEHEAQTNKQPLPLIDKGDIDALQKLFVPVRQRQQSFSAIASSVRELMDYLQGVNLEVAKLMLDHVHTFLNLKAKEL